MIYNQDITLDLNTNTSYLVVGAKQGDNNGRTLTATILENGEPFRIPETTQASYRIRKPNGDAGWNSADIYPLEHKVVITLTAQDLSTSGRCYADILLTVGTTRIGTVSFIIDVQAAPNIVEGALASEAFGYLYDMVDQAGSIIESAQAWAEGKRSTEDVLGDSYSIYSTRGLTVSLNFETFKQEIDPPTIGKITVYTFTYTTEGWEYSYNNEIVDMPSLGFTITGTPDRGDIIEVTASFADPAWHNNSLYYRQRAEAWANGQIDGTNVPSTDEAYHNNAKYYKEESDRLGQSWATGFVNGVRIPSTDPAYEQNASWLAQTYATGEFNGAAVSTTDPTYKNNSKFYKEVIENSRVGTVVTADPGKPAQASATFHIDQSGTDDAYEFDFTLPSVKPHATISVTPLSYTENPTASVQVHDVPGEAASGEEGNLQKSFDFALGIPRGIYTGISNDVTVRTVNTLEPGTNAAVRVYATDAEIEVEQPREKQFIFEFDLPRGNTGATGAVGQTGPKGDTGAKGDKGDKGDTGATGAQGLKGDTGAIGPVGPQGATGQQGMLGATGATGAAGRGITNVVLNNDYTLTFTFTDNTTYTTPSIRGPQGAQGIQGPKGDQGLQGIQGLQGPQGVQGPQGQTGTQGSQGNAGVNSVAIQIGTVTEAATGSGPSITASTDPDTGIVTLDFVLPTGATPITIDDTTISIAETWSSSKISGELTSINSDITALQNQVAASTTGLLDRTTALESSTNSLSSNVATLQSEVETVNTGLLSRATVLETAVNTLQTEVENNTTGVLVRTTALETTVGSLELEVEDPATGLLVRTTTLETDIDALESNIPGLSSRIGTLESVVGNETLTGTIKANINDIHTQLDGTGGIQAQIDSYASRIVSCEHTVSLLDNLVESNTTGLMDRTAALEATIQTKQANLTFSDSGVGELVIALA